MAHSAPDAIVAEALELTGDEGPVFGPLTFSVPNEGLTILTGSPGSGRTALALTLAGRMAPTAGDLTVLGLTAPRDIQRHVAICGVDQLDLLERSVTVADVLTENKAWASPWYKPIRRATAEDLADACAAIYGPRELPPLDSYISQLTQLDKILLRLSLSLWHRDVGLLIMDDLEQIREAPHRDTLVRILDSLDIPVVVNTVNPLPGHHTIELDTTAGHFIPQEPRP